MRVLCIALAGFMLAGCGSSGHTETGYEPHRLGMSDAQRKGLYAPSYSMEKAAAQQEKEQEMKQRRPGAPF